MEKKIKELRKAICDKDVKEVTKLIDGGVDPNATITCVEGEGSRDVPLLPFALMYGNAAIAKELIELGANVNYDKCSPLLGAVINDDIELVTILLQHGANPNEVDGRRLALVRRAMKHANAVQIIKLLLTAGVNVNATDYMRDGNTGFTALYWVCDSLNHCRDSESLYKILDLLLLAGADPKTTPSPEMDGTNWQEICSDRLVALSSSVRDINKGTIILRQATGHTVFSNPNLRAHIVKFTANPDVHSLVQAYKLSMKAMERIDAPARPPVASCCLSGGPSCI